MAQTSPQLRVLVADDDADAVKSLAALLREEGYEVRGVHTGLGVLAGVRDFGPDVVLLDLGMPHLSGYQVARALRERYASARPLLIAITGHNRPSDRMLSQLAGFDHHIAKPYDANALLALLAPLYPRSPRGGGELRR